MNGRDEFMSQTDEEAIKNLSAAGNFKHKRDMSFCHKTTMRQKNGGWNFYLPLPF